MLLIKIYHIMILLIKIYHTSEKYFSCTLASSEVNSTQRSPLSSWWEEIMHQKLNFGLFFSILKEINSLTSMSDQDRISPYNINATSSRQVMRIKKNINLGIISWSNPKFSKLTSQELYIATARRITNEILGVKGLTQVLVLVWLIC